MHLLEPSLPYVRIDAKCNGLVQSSRTFGASCLPIQCLLHTCCMRCRRILVAATTWNEGVEMKRILTLLVIVMVVFGGLAAVGKVAMGPAPNAGDGISDGNGLSPAPAGPGSAPGPAPNAGDGIPDGSGF